MGWISSGLIGFVNYTIGLTQKIMLSTLVLFVSFIFQHEAVWSEFFKVCCINLRKNGKKQGWQGGLPRILSKIGGKLRIVQFFLMLERILIQWMGVRKWISGAYWTSIVHAVASLSQLSIVTFLFAIQQLSLQIPCSEGCPYVWVSFL